MTFPAIEEILPHRGTMLLIDRVLAFRGESVSVEYVPRADAWYADAAGNMPAWIGIELMAQAVAAHVGLRKQREGAPPKQGALLGARRYSATQPAFPAGEALRIDTSVAFRDDTGLAAYDCTISAGDKEVARATLKVFEPEDFAAFLQAGHS
jgi:predicted hotdog family 3-hydroxylacyl-ACP dehydratase